MGKPKYVISDIFNYNRYEKPYFKVGDTIKLSFTNEDGTLGDSMWVTITTTRGEVTEVCKDGKVVREQAGPIEFTGVMANNPIERFYPAYGETISFNIGQIITSFSS